MTQATHDEIKHRAEWRVNWFSVIVDLERSGYAHNAIAAAIGVAKRTVGGWKQGSAPRWEDGELLITLWAQVTGNGRERLPMVSRFDWRA